MNDDAKKNKTIYERLIWNIEIVEVCSIHQIKLFSKCPYCVSSGKYCYSSHFGFCLYCQHWLGDDLKGKSAYKVSNNLNSKVIWIEKEIKKLLTCLPDAEDTFQKKIFLDSIFTILLSQTKGDVTKFCKKFKITEMDFINLFVDESLSPPNATSISLRKLIAICCPLNISLVDILRGNVLQFSSLSSTDGYSERGTSEAIYSQMFLSQDSRKTKLIGRDEIEKAKAIMSSLLKQEPILFYKVSQIVGIRGPLLKNLLPVLSLQLSLRFKAYNKKL